MRVSSLLCLLVLSSCVLTPSSEQETGTREDLPPDYADDTVGPCDWGPSTYCLTGDTGTPPTGGSGSR